MSLRNTPERYGAVAQTFHWITLVLFVALYAAMELKGFWPKGDPVRDALGATHKALGVLMFAVAAARLGWRWFDAAPSDLAGMPAWQAKSAHGMHLALYAAMVLMPVSGLLATLMFGREVSVFGLFAIPGFAVPDKELAKTVIGAHELIANALYFVIGAHALAALWHHWMQKDDTLARMLPEQRSR